MPEPLTLDSVRQELTAAGPPGVEQQYKLLALQVVRRILERDGLPVPSWWYQLLHEVQDGRL